MACCGKRRGQLRQPPTGQSTQRPAGSAGTTNSVERAIALFEYKGTSSLTIRGIVTGKQYVFEQPGAITEVDERDRNLLLAMPSLRQL